MNSWFYLHTQSETSGKASRQPKKVKMKIIFRHFLLLPSVICLLALMTDATEALPAARNATSTSLRNRQLINSDVPTAATSINGGGNPLQSLALFQQLQATSGNNPLSVAAEIAAQNQEVSQLQTQKQQQSVLAAVQAQQQHVAAAQAALQNQNLANAQQTAVSGGVLSPASNIQSQQLQQQLQIEQQQLKAQQEILKQQVNPMSNQLSQKQILLAQLLSNPNAMNQNQLLEQIRQQQTKQQAGILTQLQIAQQQQSAGGAGSLLQQSQIDASLNGYSPFSGLFRKPSRLSLMEAMMYDPSNAGLMAGSTMNPVSVLAADSTRQQLILRQFLIQQQQQQQLLLLQQRQQQMAMMNPYLSVLN